MEVVKDLEEEETVVGQNLLVEERVVIGRDLLVMVGYRS